MAISVKVGSFTKTTAAATASQAITGVGFQPKALFFWTEGGLTSGTWAANIQHALGFTSGAAASYSLGFFAEDAYAFFFNFTGCQLSAKAITLCSRTAIIAQCDLTSFDADGFTLSWTTNNASAYIIHYVALGGTTLSGSKAINYSVTSGSPKSVTGVGFTPTALLLAGNANMNAIPTGHFDAEDDIPTIGWASGAIHQQAFAMHPSDDGSKTRLRRIQIVGDMWEQIDAAGTTKQNQVLSTFDADGFTYTQTNASAFVQIALCLGGVSAFAGTFNKATGAAPASQSVTGVGFRPAVVIFFSKESAGGTTSDNGFRLCIGASDGTNHQASSHQGKNLVAAPRFKGMDITSECLIIANNDTSTVEAQATLTSMDSDGFTLSWDVNDGNTPEIAFLALGPGTPPFTYPQLERFHSRGVLRGVVGVR